MAMDVKNFITWIRSFLDDVYAPKGQSGITLNDVYPVGSIYMSVNNVNPSTLFGGSWTKIEGKFLLSSGKMQIASSTYIEFANGATGGEWAHTLTVNEIPSHSHQTKVYNHKNGASVTNHRTTWASQGEALMETYNTGGGQAHNNMPPYLAVNMWKRTA